MSDQTLEQQSEALTGHNGDPRRIGQQADTSALVIQPKPTTVSVPTTTPRSIFTMTTDQVDRLKILSEMIATTHLSIGQKLSKGDAFLVMLKGIEIGLEPMAALDLIHIIQGKPTLSPQGMLALIHRTGELTALDISGDATQCSVTMQRGTVSHTEVFTLDDAKALNLTGKDNWKKQPAVMLKWRAVSACARIIFPDIIQGLYTQEEIGAEVEYTDEGNISTMPEPEPETPTPLTDEKSAPKDEPKDKSKDDPKPQLNQSGLEGAIAFMYPDDTEGYHRRGTIKNLLSESVITQDTPNYVAIEKIILHRAFKDFMMDEAMVWTALTIGADTGDKIIGFGDWYKVLTVKGVDRTKHLPEAWESIAAYYENVIQADTADDTPEDAASEDIPF